MNKYNIKTEFIYKICYRANVINCLYSINPDIKSAATTTKQQLIEKRLGSQQTENINRKFVMV